MSLTSVTGFDTKTTEHAAAHGRLRWLCRFFTLALGAGSAWASRSTMYPDGISYLDIGDAIWHGNWHGAINAYWSPLYPLVLGFFLKLLRPSMRWEYPLVHAVNFLIYVMALICFEFFVHTFLEHQRSRDPALPDQSESSLPGWAWMLVGYSTFIASSLLLITLSFVSGDMMVAAVIYLASAILLKLRSGNTDWRLLALLGLVLGVGYLAKAVMFLMSVAFIAVAAATEKTRARKFRCVAISGLFFLLTAGPFVLILSFAKGRPTFGDSGKINYLMNVGTTQFFTPQESDAKHPVHQLSALPHAYEYGSPIGGTYPLWYDPSYWHDGIRPHIDFKRQVHTMLLAGVESAFILFSPSMGLCIAVPLIFLYLVSPHIGQCLARASRDWELWIPALAGIALYSLVVIEPRYLAAQFCILWIVGFSGVRLPASMTSRRMITGATLAVVLFVYLATTWQISHALGGRIFAQKDIATPECVEVAKALAANGVKRGDKIAVISNWLFPSRQGAYIARLARVQIIAEARSDEYWAANTETRSELMKEFESAGARAVLTFDPPSNQNGWTRLGATRYYMQFLYSNSGPAARLTSPVPALWPASQFFVDATAALR